MAAGSGIADPLCTIGDLLSERRWNKSTGESFEYNPFAPSFQLRAHETYQDLRDHHPVYHSAEHNFWAISRFDDVWAATLDLERLTTEGMEEAKALKPILNYLDPPRHDQLRALVSRAFTFRRVQEMETKIRRIARELMERRFLPHFDLTMELEWVTSRWMRGHEEIPIRFSST